MFPISRSIRLSSRTIRPDEAINLPPFHSQADVVNRFQATKSFAYISNFQELQETHLLHLLIILKDGVASKACHTIHLDNTYLTHSGIFIS